MLCKKVSGTPALCSYPLLTADAAERRMESNQSLILSLGSSARSRVNRREVLAIAEISAVQCVNCCVRRAFPCGLDVLSASKRAFTCVPTVGAALALQLAVFRDGPAVLRVRLQPPIRVKARCSTCRTARHALRLSGWCIMAKRYSVELWDWWIVGQKESAQCGAEVL